MNDQSNKQKRLGRRLILNDIKVMLIPEKSAQVVLYHDFYNFHTATYALKIGHCHSYFNVLTNWGFWFRWQQTKSATGWISSVLNTTVNVMQVP
jgi:hypothetical protein